MTRSNDHSSDIESQSTLLDRPTPAQSILEKPEPEQPQQTEHSLLCLCFDLSRLSPKLRFGLLCLGVFFFFLLNSWVEEYTFKQLPKFQYGWYLTFFELFCFSCFAVLDRLFLSREPVLGHRATLQQHGAVAVAMTVSRGLTNVSLQFLNYPTQIIFKSMKLITVMIGSLFMLNASFSLKEYGTAVALVLAAIMFSLGDTDVSVEFPWKGVIIVLFSLVGDAWHSTTQDKLLRTYHATTAECMLFTNFFAATISFIYITFTGELFDAIHYCQLYPQAYGLFVIRSAVIYLGVLCFILTIKNSGVVVATGVTTVRKILSILLSFVFFPKAWSSKYYFGGAFFLASLSLTYWDQIEKEKKRVEEKKDRARQAALQ